MNIYGARYADDEARRRFVLVISASALNWSVADCDGRLAFRRFSISECLCQSLLRGRLERTHSFCFLDNHIIIVSHENNTLQINARRCMQLFYLYTGATGRTIFSQTTAQHNAHMLLLSRTVPYTALMSRIHTSKPLPHGMLLHA